ncbi:MAG: response regulator [Synergistaceae bacterium]|jgi:signal transduction histidine kinase/HPt (histidine-containing phosphotransfer) domain-containing protein/AmiR/NasT family two-component response regulator|nr:response regulator [Synergistaceae bacterium]
MDGKRLIKENYWQVFFVVMAFFLMTLTGSLSISVIVRRHLVQGVEGAIRTTEASVTVGLSEMEATINNVANTVRGMLKEGTSRERILVYLQSTSAWLRQKNFWRTGFYGVYGYIEGESLNGIGIDPGNEFIPQTRPWFDAAVRNSGSKTAYTEPYTDWITGKTILTAVRNLYSDSGEYYGIIAIDMDMSWLQENARGLQMADGSYGVILNQDLTVVGHPKDKYIGLQLQDLGEGQRKIHDELIFKGVVSSMSVRNVDNIPVTVSFSPISNGWYVGVVTPFGSYYKDVYRTAAILSLLGFCMMTLLIYILLKLSAAKTRSDEESRSKSSFLARMSHEIRTPMNAIIGMSELAWREYGEPKGLEYIKDIRRAGDHLLSIINDILDFSKIESDRLELVNARYEMASLLNDVFAILRPRLNEKVLSFTYDVDTFMPAFMTGDVSRVRQVLLNLLSNAVKYTEKGFVKFTARCSKNNKNGGGALLTFTVEDSGIGIRPEDLGKLFGRFSRVDSKRNINIEGTGLGLSIAQSLCRAMGGDITVKSEYGKGSVFTATMAQQVADLRPMASLTHKNASWAEAGKPRFSAPGFRLLVVDDNATNLKVTEGLLAPYEMEVETRQSGEESLERVKEKDFELVMMDHMMPGMDGIEAAKAIRALGGRCTKLPIVALTANAMSGMREMFLENGFDDFLPKPIEISKLHELLEKWIPKERRAPIKKKDDLTCKVEKADGRSAAVPEPRKGGDGPPIEAEGLDAARGLTQCGGSPDAYREVLSLYRRDAEEKMKYLSFSYAESELKTFTVHVHGLKTSSANIGASDLSKMAAALEAAGKDGDMEYIRARVDSFRQALSEMCVRVQAALPAETHEPPEKSGEQSGERQEEPVSLESLERLETLQEALEARDVGTVDKILSELSKAPLTPRTVKLLSEISDLVLTAEFEKAMEKLMPLLRP